MNENEFLIKLHSHLWNILNDLTIDETLSEVEAADVADSMENLAEMFIEALGVEILKVEAQDDKVRAEIALTFDR